MTVLKYTTLVLAVACCNFALAQQQGAQQQGAQQQGEQTRRAERVEGRRDQISQNREERQENRDARQTERDPDGRALTLGGNANQSNMDQYIATCLLFSNQEEVALAQVAVDRAENENVKQFAQMLVNDHQKAIQKLQQHAKPGMGLEGSGQTTVSIQSTGNDQYASDQSATAQQYTANRADLDRDAGSSGAYDQILKLQQQATQECLTMTKSMMQEKQGAEFDKAFAGSQIGAHVGMLAKLKASEQHASSELASILQESQQMTKNHLEQAKQLCDELESMQASNR